MPESDLERRARLFAEEAHKGKKRKYTGEDYVVHCMEVADLVRTVPHTEEMLAAAWLHDTVEDCGVTFSTLSSEFGPHVTILVYFLTDKSKPSDGNRAARKAIDRDHTDLAIPHAKTIKLADLINNTSSIVRYDPPFAKVYLAEKRALLEVLKDGDPTLWQMAWDTLLNAEAYLRGLDEEFLKKHPGLIGGMTP